MERYLDQLNEAQREATVQTDGPMIVIAGAGSGKTRVLTYKIAYLMHQGVDPFNILALTFTNKAAKEMKIRIAEIVGESEAKNLWMGTFHSVFAKLLRADAPKLGFPSNFTIYDTQDSQRLISSIIGEMGLDNEIYKLALGFEVCEEGPECPFDAYEYLKSRTFSFPIMYETFSPGSLKSEGELMEKDLDISLQYPFAFDQMMRSTITVEQGMLTYTDDFSGYQKLTQSEQTLRFFT